MPWYNGDYPPSYKNQPKKLRDKAVEIANEVKLHDHSRKALKQFENEITKLPEVLECLHVTGEYDFMLKVIVKDIAAYQQFLESSVFENVPMPGCAKFHCAETG